VRRIVVDYNDGGMVIWKCSAASYGHDSRNMILSNAARDDSTIGRENLIELVLISLANVRLVTEGPW
jgi:hypothetical protein